jgi:hypothetical protein
MSTITKPLSALDIPTHDCLRPEPCSIAIAYGWAVDHEGNNIVASPRQQAQSHCADISQSPRFPRAALAHLALSLFLNRMLDSPESCGLAIITAYFDDSGHHGDTKALVVCGFVSPIDQWLSFEGDWRVILRMPQFDLEHLHMKELRSGVGRFAKFQNNLPLQRDLFERVYNILRVRTERTFAIAIILDDYDKVNADYKLFEAIGPALVIAAEFAIARTIAWWTAKHRDLPMSIVIDQGIDHFGLLDDRIYSRYGFRLVPASVKQTPPLQGSDVAAWEIHRALSGLATGAVKDYRQLRGSFKALLRKLSIDTDSDEDRDNASWFVLDEAEMRRVCEKMQLPLR